MLDGIWYYTDRVQKSSSFSIPISTLDQLLELDTRLNVNPDSLYRNPSICGQVSIYPFIEP